MPRTRLRPYNEEIHPRETAEPTTTRHVSMVGHCLAFLHAGQLSGLEAGAYAEKVIGEDRPLEALNMGITTFLSPYLALGVYHILSDFQGRKVEIS